MASNGSFNTTSYTYEGVSRHLIFSWSETSQSIANNTTTISWSVTGGGTNGGYMHGRNIKVVIDGTTVYWQGEGTTSNYINLYKGTVVASGTHTFTHDSNGAKTFSVSVEAGIYVWAVNCSGSASYTLNTIPRKSTLTASNGTLGTSQTLTVTKKATSFTHTITYKCGSASGTIATKSSSTSIAWTPPITLAEQAPSANSVSVILTIETFNGSTSVGTSTATITCTIPETSTYIPVLLPTISDAMGYASKYGGYVQGQSKLSVSIETYGAYGAWITSVKTVFAGATYTEKEFTSNVISNSGTLPVTITVTDSRGRKTEVTSNITVLPYSFPQITAFSTSRCNSDGTLNPSGSYLLAKFSAVVSALNSKNTVSYYIGYKKVTETNHTAVLQSSLNNKYTVTDATYVFPADPTSSYTVIFTAVDDFKTTRFETTGSSSKKVWSLLKKNGKIVGAAVGKIAEYEDTFDIGWKVKFSGGGDCVIEIGESNGWTYRKWDSGVAECWKIHEFSTTINTAFGSLYCGNATARQTYPFVFAEKPVEHVTLQSGSTQAILYVETGEHGVNGTNSSARYNVFRPGAMTASQTFYLSFYVIGKWK